VFYGDKCAIDQVSIDIPQRYVTAFIGPSGCGKSTFLRAQPDERHDRQRPRGRRSCSTARTSTAAGWTWCSCARVGMVFQKPNPFPKSIYENIAYGPASTD
jgi:phosphate transport system ATP-binding protein